MTIRLADAGSDREQASSIINRMYGWRGYGSEHRVAEKNNSVTFTASSDGEMVGTLTLTVDSAARLAVDATFPDELREFRLDPGTSLCELTKFAFNPSQESRPLLATLFHVIFLYGTLRYDCTDLLIEVNPRHVRFYEVMLRFSRVGSLRTNQAVDAPSQLMRLKVSDIRSNIDLYGACESSSGHSLYRYFFDRKDEREVKARLGAFIHADRAKSLPKTSRPPFNAAALHEHYRLARSASQNKRAAA